ncbi:MAG: PorP/SprF family type IX secretion system membrane protein, partial [Bacteroidota bacterium]
LLSPLTILIFDKKTCEALKQKRTLLLLGNFLLLLSLSSLRAQDVHFSQYWNNPIDLNPALAGVAREDTRVFAAYKSQWSSVPVGYTTFSGAMDTKWESISNRKGYFGVGAIFTHDEAGDGDWSLNNLGGMISYTKQLGKGIFGGIGTQIGIGHRSFKLLNLTFDEQFNGEFFDPTLDNGEQFTDTETVFIDMGVGFNLHLQNDDQRTKLDVGVGLHHLNTPAQNFYSTSTIDLPMRKDFYAMGVLKITQQFDVLGNALLRFQDEYREIVLGSALRIHLNTKPTKELAFDIGANLRTGDAVLPYVGLLYHQWRFGFVYDINTSPFSAATNSNGGPEFVATYTFTKPRALGSKLCPLF